MATTVDLGNVIGPRGPQGVQGIQGPKGDTGPKGATGAADTSKLPVYVALGTLCADRYALNTEKTYVGFPNVSIRTSTYNDLYKYLITEGRLVKSVEFQAPQSYHLGSTISYPTYGSQLFTVSQYHKTVASDVLNFDILADCFINNGLVTNASSTMLNLARVELAMHSKTEVTMNISSSSAMGMASNSNVYIIVLMLTPARV